jgi:single-strand DNA-binding protein
MACLKMPEVNTVLIAGNLTKDPVVRKTTTGIPVLNFCLASNRKYRDANNHWAEDVCYVGVVAWSRLAESCVVKLRKGSAVLVDGELQSRTWHAEDGSTRTVVEIKAHRIQFLNKQEFNADQASTSETGEELPSFDEEFELLESRYAETIGLAEGGMIPEEARLVSSGGCTDSAAYESLGLRLKPRSKDEEKGAGC